MRFDRSAGTRCGKTSFISGVVMTDAEAKKALEIACNSVLKFSISKSCLFARSA
jgi:hypothetical protein